MNYPFKKGERNQQSQSIRGKVGRAVAVAVSLGSWWSRDRSATNVKWLYYLHPTFFFSYYRGRTGTPGVNPYTHEQNMQTPHSEVWPKPEPESAAQVLITVRTWCPRKRSSAAPVDNHPLELLFIVSVSGFVQKSKKEAATTLACCCSDNWPGRSNKRAYSTLDSNF